MIALDEGPCDSLHIGWEQEAQHRGGHSALEEGAALV